MRTMLMMMSGGKEEGIGRECGGCLGSCQNGRCNSNGCEFHFVCIDICIESINKCVCV